MAELENYHTIRYGNKDGELKFGHIHSDGTKSAFLVRSGSDPLHYISLDDDGEREGGTINRCTGTFQVKCGDNVKGDAPAFIVEALSGDIILMAKNGNIRMEASKDILIKASGSGNDTGNINIEANERVNIFAKEVNINGKQAARFITSGVGEITCKTALNIQASACSAASAVCKDNPTKFGLNADKLGEI
jgi:hypothetical protein